MIETEISANIWNNKYRYKQESESDFYLRLVGGLFDGLSDIDVSRYFTLLNVTNRSEFYKALFNVFSTHSGMLAGRALFSLGTDKLNQSLSNCFVVPIESDSMAAIMKAVSDAAMTMKAGGGVGYHFSILRPKGSLINSSGACSTGVLSFMNIFNTTCSTIESGGNRRGAQIGILGIWHPDVLNFTKCKQHNLSIPEELKPYKNFNLSILVSDAFMQALKEDKGWDLIFPDTSFDKYDAEWDGNIKYWQEKGYPVKCYATIKASELWDAIMKSNYDHAEPGVLFEDTINKMNTLWMTEYILACNPCGEQPLIPNGSCNLGSLNLPSFVKNCFSKDAAFDFKTFKHTATCMFIMLDRMLDINYYPLQAQRDVVIKKRQVGLGITGLGDMLAMLCMKYSSEDALKFVENMMKILRETVFNTNVSLARLLGPFPEWSTFDKETKQKFVEGAYLTTLPEALKSKMLEHGCRCSRALSIAPTGTMSLFLNNVSSGAEPIFLLEYNRKVKKSSDEHVIETVETYSWKKYKERFKECTVETKPDFFETTEDLAVNDHINMQAVLQKYICTAISKTINVPEDYEYSKFKNIYQDAYSLGIKGCTTYRPNSSLSSVLSKKEDSKEYNLDGRPKIIMPCSQAPRRPKELPCDIIFTNIKGEPWTVLIGLIDGKPYEAFAGNTTEELYLPKSCKEGIIRKQGQGLYELEVVIRNRTVVYKDLASILMTDGQKATTRVLSLSLRHGIPIKYIVSQLKKTNGSVVEFSTAVSRVLSKYIDAQTLSDKDRECPQCKEVSLSFEEGCIKCMAGCGYSRCG